jgi:hypothetical protein
MKLTEKELQAKIEQGLPETSADAQAYRHVFSTLKKDPDFNLPISICRSTSFFN